MDKSQIITLDIGPEFDNERLDVALTSLLKSGEFVLGTISPTRSKVSKWIQAGSVSIDDQVIFKPSYKLSAGSLVTLPVPEIEPLNLEPDSSIKLNIVYEDQDLLVIDKQPGIAVHPGAGIKSGTLVHGILAHVGSELSVGEVSRPGIVHRLDKDTSGLMVVAKNDIAYQGLVLQFVPPRTIHRTYRALVCKAPKGGNKGCIDKPIGRDPKNRKRMAIVDDGRAAVTDWSILEQYSFGALLELTLHTGRTHQIRVHLASEFASILGDPVYGIHYGNLSKKLRDSIGKLSRQALHACALKFIHPLSKQELAFTSDIPQDMKDLQEILLGN